MDQKFRFAFVSNSAEIAATVKAFCDSSTEEMEIHLATMEEAVPVARKLLAQGVEVVMGGGATGRLLRKSLDRPVVTIARTPLDVLRALIKARDTSKDIVLTSFDTPAEGIDVYESLLGVKIDQVVFKTTAELARGIERKIRQGRKIVVGSGICREISRSFSVEGIVIYPSIDVIVRALEEARAIALAQRKERSDARRLNAILQAITEGILSIDAQGKVTLINETAARMFGLAPENVVGMPLPDMVRGMGLLGVLESGEPDIDQIRRVAGNDLVVNTLPVKVDGKIQTVVSSFRLTARIQSIDRRLKEKLYTKGFAARYTLNHLKGESPAMVRMKDKAARYAATDAAVLILGETGTGKEIVAQAIHNASPRRDNPFIAVNCAALPETLLESELFGYEEGAFTGARRGGKPGLFELANEGSLFLDEIADISPGLQVRLLRVIEEREVMRLGGDRIVPVDVRLVSSTWCDLAGQVCRNRFRADLYFRLAVLQLEVPALRHRPEDIPLLLLVLLRRCGISETVIHTLFTPEIEMQLSAYRWPGNVRELDSLAHRFAALESSTDGDKSELLMRLLGEIQNAGFDAVAPGATETEPAASTGAVLKQQVAEFESRVIRQVLAESGNDRQEAARRLGISVNTLWRKLKK